MSEPKTLDDIAVRVVEELFALGKSKRKPDGSTFRTVRVALTEAYERGRAEERVLLADHE